MFLTNKPVEIPVCRQLLSSPPMLENEESCFIPLIIITKIEHDVSNHACDWLLKITRNVMIKVKAGIIAKRKEIV